MAELRGGRDEPDDDDPSARRIPADGGGAPEEVLPPREPHSRAEYAVIARQQSKLIDTGQEDTDQNPEPSDADVLERFEPSRAGLPEISREDAVKYIEEHYADRPWLATVRECSPDVHRVFAALDLGHGHAHIRHDGWVTEEMNKRRVQNLEDPAQLDQAKREGHIDGLTPGNLSHRCGDTASRIINPEAFAVAFARGIKHPDVQAALDSNGSRPEAIVLPISDVLGKDGHKFCSGWRLEPVNGSMEVARANRRAWAAGDQSGPKPRVRPVETFKGGTVTFAFRRSAIGGHEISTMYVNPPDE